MTHTQYSSHAQTTVSRLATACVGAAQLDRDTAAGEGNAFATCARLALEDAGLAADQVHVFLALSGPASERVSGIGASISRIEADGEGASDFAALIQAQASLHAGLCPAALVIAASPASGGVSACVLEREERARAAGRPARAIFVIETEARENTGAGGPKDASESGLAAVVETMLAGETGAADRGGVSLTSRAWQGARIRLEPPPPPAHETLVPLTEEQREIWSACQLGDAASANFNESATLYLRGSVDEAAIEHAVCEIVARHEALRSTFAPDGSVQRIASEVACELERIERPADDVAWRAWLREEAARPFDLERGPLFRFRLARLPDGAAFVFTAHHLVCDGWSYETILHELGAAYSARRRGEPSPFRKPAAQISTFAGQADERRNSPRARTALDYWKSALAGMPGPIELPEDLPRPEHARFNGSRETFFIPPSLAGEVRKFAQARRATVFSVLFAAYTALLHRLSGARDMLVGVPVAGQNIHDAATLVGHCVHFLPVRQQVEPESSFAGHLALALRATVEAVDHAHVSFGELLRALRWRRDPARPSPICVTFSLNPSLQPVRFEGLELELRQNPRSTINAELCFTIIDRSEGFVVECDYCTDLFTADTIRRWFGHFQTLLEAAVAAPETAVERLRMLRGEEIASLTGPQPAAGDPGAEAFRPLHALFEQRVDACPEAIALIDATGPVTYAELETRANRLAHRLIALGAGPEQPVVLLFQRSSEFVAAMLAVLKSGAAFVPLDASWPAQRQARVIELCEARIVVTGGLEPPPLPAAGVHVLDIHVATAALATDEATRPALDHRPDQLAYIIFTSGSTGDPKGVMIEHRSIALHIESITRRYDLVPADRALLFHSTAFDPTIEQLFSAFHAGASVWIRGEELWTGREFADLVASAGLTVVDLPPRYLQQLLQEFQGMTAAPEFAGLRLVVVGGEALPAQAVALWRACGYTETRLINSYGPTECSVTATCHELPAQPCARELAGRVPIGRPHGPVRAYVLDGRLQPVAPGVKGELCLGGPTVGRGYFAQPELTAARFLADPFLPGGRIYRTGDQARLLPDGSIEFIGRFDRQVQLRGYRVELSEIETQLALHPHVRAAAVLALEEADGAGELYGFVEAVPGAAADPAELRRHLASRLPAYMVPARIVAIDRLPTDGNGKTDYRRLPRSESGGLPAPAVLTPPADAAEEKLLEIWRRNLGRDDLGVESDFFELGGHSLMAIRMLGEINQAFGSSLSMARLFEAPTVRDLASKLDASSVVPATHAVAGAAAEPATGWKYLMPLQPRGDSPPLFLCAGGHGSEEEFVVMAALSRMLGEDRPVIGLRVGGHDRLVPIHRDTEHMAAAVFDEIRRFQPAGPYHLLGECVGGVLAAAIAHRAESLGETVRFLGMLDTAVPRFAEPLHAWIESHWITKMIERALVHVRRLREVPLRDIPAYLRDRGRWARAHVENGVKPVAGLGLMPEDPARYHYFQMLIRHKPRRVRATITALASEEFHRTGLVRAWHPLTESGVAVVPLAGTHYTYIRSEAAENARRIRACLDTPADAADRAGAWKIPLKSPNFHRGRQRREPSQPTNSGH